MNFVRILSIYVVAVLIASGCASCPKCGGGSSTQISDRQRPNEVEPFQFNRLDLASEDELLELQEELAAVDAENEELRLQLEEAIAAKNASFNALGINGALGFGAIDPNLIDSTRPQVALSGGGNNGTGTADLLGEPRPRRATPAPIVADETLRAHGS